MHDYAYQLRDKLGMVPLNLLRVLQGAPFNGQDLPA